MIEGGHSRRSLAREFNLAESSVRHMYNRYVATGSYTHMPRTGRLRVTTAQEGCNIAREAMQNPFLTTTTIAQCASTYRNMLVTSHTVQMLLKEEGLSSYKPTLRPILMRGHQAAQLSSHTIMLPGLSMIENESYSPTSLVSYCVGPMVVIEFGGGWELDTNTKILFDG